MFAFTESTFVLAAAALPCGNGEQPLVGRQPFGLAGQRAAPAFLPGLAEGAHRLGGGHDALCQIVDGRVERAGVGRKKAAVVAFTLQHLPGWRIKKAAGLAGFDTEEGGHRLRQLHGVQVGLLLLVVWRDQREGHGGPVNLRETGQLFPHLRVGLRCFGVETCFMQQTRDDIPAGALQPFAHGAFD